MSLRACIAAIPVEWPLRAGLGLTYVHSGMSLIREPSSWLGFVPPWFAGLVGGILPIERYLVLQGVGELILATVFLAWFLNPALVRIAASLAVMEFAGILFFIGIDGITFRDLGLIGAASSLALLMRSPRQPA